MPLLQGRVNSAAAGTDTLRRPHRTAPQCRISRLLRGNHGRADGKRPAEAERLRVERRLQDDLRADAGRIAEGQGHEGRLGCWIHTGSFAGKLIGTCPDCEIEDQLGREEFWRS
jgi:hypothetical protein